jgi:hypothetical protein
MLRRVTNNISPRLKKLQKGFDQIPKQAHVQFKKITPIKTGNARKNTGFNGTDTIDADYPYANKLNAGYSKQARDGMTKPTIDYIRGLVRKKLR